MLNQYNVATTPNNSLTKLRLEIKAIFTPDAQTQGFLTKQAKENNRNNQLLFERIEKIQQFFNVPNHVYLTNNEKKIVDKIYFFTKRILDILENSSSIKENWHQFQSFSNELFFLTFKYVFYRVDGIQEHFRTGNIASTYPKTDNSSPIFIYDSAGIGDRILECSFATHKAIEEENIRKYKRSSLVLNILSCIGNIAPQILQKIITIEEYLHTPRNEYMDKGVSFSEPPYLQELLNVLNALSMCLSTKKVNIQDLTAIKTFNLVYKNFSTKNLHTYLVKNCYQIIETLSQWTKLTADINEFEAKRLPDFLMSHLATSCSFSSFIPLPLLNVTQEKINEAKKKLRSPEADIKERMEAKRTLSYASIPWDLLRYIGAACLKKTKDSRFENVILTAFDELEKEFCNFLQPIFKVIEVEIIINKLENDNQLKRADFSGYFSEEISNFREQLPNLQIAGDFSSDIIFMEKIEEVLNKSKLDDLLSLNAVCALLRIISIVGECEKHLSDSVKNRMACKDILISISALRNKSVHANKLEKFLSENNDLIANVVQDLNSIQEEIKKKKENISGKNWSEIKIFYSESSVFVKKEKPNNAIDDILFFIETSLSIKDYQELRDTLKEESSEEIESKNKILNFFENKIDVCSVKSDIFDSWLNKMPNLKKYEKDQLRSMYSQLIKNKAKQDKLNVCISLIKNYSSEFDKNIDKAMKFSKKFKEIDSLENLKMNLEKLNIIHAVDIWKNKWEKTRQFNNDINVEENSSEMIRKSISSVKGMLIQLGKIKDIIIPFEGKEIYEKVDISLTLEYHFILLRNHINDIENGLIYFRRYDADHPAVVTLNQVTRVIGLRLDSIREYANALAHLHNVLQPNGVTFYGEQLIIGLEILDLVKSDPVFQSRSLLNELKDYYRNLLMQNKLLLTSSGSSPS